MTIELLCPAGALANLKAAVASGADAIYFGMPKFSARNYAKNFNKEYLTKLIQICKSNNVKTYLTMNTLIKNSEIQDFFKQLKFAYLSGIDAVIIQDPSLIKIIKKQFPELKVHMSTQTGILNSFHANLFSDSNRINLARELSENQIKEIRKKFNKEIEIFVHGALCISISGSCLFSSFIGGRSGNRGMCSQPCRKIYNKNYYLSTKELCLIKEINNIKKLNINSIKIEGRMRTPYYVAVTTSIYKQALNNPKFKITKEVLEKLNSAYSREFTKGKFKEENVFNRKNSQGITNTQITEYKVKTKEIIINRKCNLNLPEISNKKNNDKKLLVRVYNKRDAIQADKNGADIIYLDLFDENFLEIKNSITKPLYAVTPRIMFDSDIEDIINKINKLKPAGLVAGNLGILKLNLKIPIHLDYNCNCFNDYSLSYFENLNAFPIISPELSIKELTEFKNKNFAVLVHGKIRLMTLAHELEKNKIKDEKGFEFIINKIKNGCEILNKKEIGFFNKSKNLLNSDITNFYIDTDKNVGNIVKIYRNILDGKTIDVSDIKNNYVLGWSKEGVLDFENN